MKDTKAKNTKFSLWASRKLPECKQMVKVITASLDRKLSLGEWLMMKIHLLSCDPCLNFLIQIKFIRSALSKSDERLAAMDPSVKLRDDARARIKDALRSPNSP